MRYRSQWWRQTAAAIAIVGLLAGAAPAGASHGEPVYRTDDDCWEETRIPCSRHVDGWHPGDYGDLDGAKEYDLWLDPEEASRQLASMPLRTSGSRLNPIVAVDMNQVAFPDVLPYLDPEIGRIRVPLRFVAEEMGASVDWDETTWIVTIFREGLLIQLTVDQTTATVNERLIHIDAPARLVPPGRVMVPLRFISEAFGATVDWVGDVRPEYLSGSWGQYQVWVWPPWGFWGTATIQERFKVHQHWFFRPKGN